jgi:hypothetical protein
MNAELNAFFSHHPKLIHAPALDRVALPVQRESRHAKREPSSCNGTIVQAFPERFHQLNLFCDGRGIKVDAGNGNLLCLSD